MSKTLTRRTILTATAASAALAAPAVALAAIEPLAALETLWRFLRENYDRESAATVAIHDSLPDHAKGGWPRVPNNSPLFDNHYLRIVAAPGYAISLPKLRELNYNLARFERTRESPAEMIAEVCAEGRERVRWWLAAHREQKRLSRESGLDAAEDRCTKLLEAISETEERILSAQPATIDGLRVQLAVLANIITVNYEGRDGTMAPQETWLVYERGIVDVHASATRLAAGGAA